MTTKTRYKKMITLLFIITVLMAAFSCNQNLTGPYEDPPGRRDYVWTVDTLAGLNSPRHRMWGSSPTDIWATTTSNWDVSISHYNGIKWTSYGVPGIILPCAIFGFSNAAIFIGESGNGKVWRYNGNSWEPFSQLVKDGHKNIWIENLWGQSLNDFYAVGAYPDEQGYANNSVIGHYYKGDWKILNTEALYGVVEPIYKNSSDNKTYLQVYSDDSTKIYEYIDGNFQKLYGNIWTKGLQSDISLINDEVYFILGNEIATRRNNQFQTVLQVDNPDFYQRIWGRNSKDIFLLMTDGLAHYNGSDIQYLFNFSLGKVTPWTQIYGAALFENDVFFLVDEPPTGLSLVYHGKLK